MRGKYFTAYIVYKLRILDLGCGHNYIAQHFKEHAKIKVSGYDHVVENSS